MGYSFQILKLGHIEKRRWIFTVGAVAFTYLLFQSLLLPYENALRSLLPDGEVPEHDESSFLAVHSVAKSVMVRNPLAVGSSEFSKNSMLVKMVKNEDVGGAIGDRDERNGNDRDGENGFPLDKKDLENGFVRLGDENLSSDASSNDVVHFMKESLVLESVRNHENSSALDEASEGRHGILLEQIVKPNYGVSIVKKPEENTSLTSEKSGDADTTIQLLSSVAEPTEELALNTTIEMVSNSGKKKMRCDMPPKLISSIYEMNHILVRHRASSSSMVKCFICF